jgi:hypothetical protein
MKNARMPNKGSTKYSDTDSGAGGANHGKSTGARKTTSQRKDTVGQVSNENRYPRGLS